MHSMHVFFFFFFEGGGLWKVLTVCHNKNNQGHRDVAFRQEIFYRKSVR